jgi:hypothetical protein
VDREKFTFAFYLSITNYKEKVFYSIFVTIYKSVCLEKWYKTELLKKGSAICDSKDLTLNGLCPPE